MKLMVKLIWNMLLFTTIACKDSSVVNRETVQIDHLLKKADDLLYKDVKKSNFYAVQAVRKSEKINDSYRTALSCCYLAKNYSFLKEFDSCHYYLKKGLDEEAAQSDHFLQELFLYVTSNYYSRLGLLEQQVKVDFELLRLLENKNDVQSKLLYSYTLMSVADNYTETSDFKLANQFAQKSLKIVNQIQDKEYLNTPNILKRKYFLYYYMNMLYIRENQPEKALYYLNKSYFQASLDNNNYTALVLECYGDYYMKNGRFKEAVDYYKESFKNKQRFYQRTAYVDSKIAEAYFKTGKTDSANIYLIRSSKQRDLDLKIRNKYAKQAQLFIDEQENKKNKAENHFKIFTISFIICILLVIIFHLDTSAQKVKQDISVDIQEKDILIQDHEEEISHLNTKLSKSFEELSQLAKQNSPQFWIRFQEIYPHYCTKMLLLNPNLKTSELTLTAFIYLGFSSKEIAAYTFKSVKTIENNRYNFRKKINLLPDQDLLIWLREYMK